MIRLRGLLIRFSIAALLVWILFEAGVTWQQGSGGVDTDFGRYMDVAHRVLGGGTFYAPEQVAGPHVTGTRDAMYPPIAIDAMLPFAVIPVELGGLVWYAVPIAVIAATLIYWRPRGWWFVALLACLATPQTRDIIVLGNPGLWIGAFAALATRWPWVSALVFLKPSLFPFAVPGIRDRRWWLLAALLAAVSLVQWQATLDWLHVVLNARGPYSGPLYGLNNVPLLLVPYLARRGSARIYVRTTA